MSKIIRWLHPLMRNNALWLVAVLFALFVFAQTSAPLKCAAQGSCPEPAAYGRQPFPDELVDVFDRAGMALNEYEGTLVCISHDIHFVRSVANAVFHVYAGSVRKFPGSFDYYLQKKDSFLDDTQKSKSIVHHRAEPNDVVKQEAKQQAALKKEQEKKQKLHNTQIKEQVKKLQKEREKLNLEHYSKSRAVSHPRDYHDDSMLEEYVFRLQDIEKRIAEISVAIKRLRQKKIK